MKTLFFPYIILLFILGTFSNACNSASEEMKKAKQDSADAAMKLDQARRDSVAEHEKIKSQWSAEIAANEKMLADYRVRVAQEEKKQREKDEQELAALEQREADLKSRLNNYDTNTGNDWVDFKNGFRNMINDFDDDMQAFGQKIAKWTGGNK
jgi:chromosome segregation ATPase